MTNEINTTANNTSEEETNCILNFIQFLNKVFDNNENFRPGYPHETDKVSLFGKHEICELVGNELKKVKNNSADNKLSSEFYSALENAGYDFRDEVDIDYNYYAFGKKHKQLLIYY